MDFSACLSFFVAVRHIPDVVRSQLLEYLIYISTQFIAVRFNDLKNEIKKNFNCIHFAFIFKTMLLNLSY